MNAIRRFAVLSAAAAGLGWLSSPALFAQPSVGGAKKKAMESKDAQQKKENDKAAEKKEPVVFSMGPDEKAHFEIDPASKRNVIKFESKAPGETIDSKVSQVSGHLDFNPRKLDAVEGQFTVKWKDVDTGNKTRNNHMMGKDWVDAQTYPDVVFTVTGIENATSKDKPVKAIKCLLVGKMAMHGQEKEMKIPVTLSYLEVLPVLTKKGEAPREGLAIKAGKFKIALADFDIKGKAGSVGSKVAGEQEFTTVSFMLTGPEHKVKPVMPKAPVKKPPPKGA